MSLIQCPDCGTPVSDLAASCVKCGRPISAAPPAMTLAAEARPTVIEQTGKEWKMLQLASGVAMCIGTVTCAAGSTTASGWLWSLGLLGWFLGRFGAWWNHA
jgi:hypothetical protein